MIWEMGQGLASGGWQGGGGEWGEAKSSFLCVKNKCGLYVYIKLGFTHFLSQVFTFGTTGDGDQPYVPSVHSVRFDLAEDFIIIHNFMQYYFKKAYTYVSNNKLQFLGT